MKQVFYLMIVAVALVSCRSNKTIPYFKNIPDSAYSAIQAIPFEEPKITYDDMLEISVHTLNPEATAAITEGGITATTFQSAGSAVQRVKAYPVSKRGEINVPMLGAIPVLGLTIQQLTDEITRRANEILEEPAVQVRIVNFKVTVLGEVTSPRTYNVPTEKISILDAIGMAGDLTIFGRRENVMLIRETEAGRQITRFNLNDAKIFNSPDFYLKQNDVVYVEPSKSRIANSEAPKIAIISSVLAVISTITILIARY